MQEKQRLKIWWYLAGILIGLIILLILQWPENYPKMVVCDVGQGDAIIISKGSLQVLVDGGPSSDKILSCLGSHIPFWDRKIELIVMTNTDFDHMNGLSAVVERYRVMQFVTADGVGESDALNRLVDVLDRRGLQVTGVEQGELIRVGKDDPLVFRVLWPVEVEESYLAVFSGQTNNRVREQILGASAKRGDVNERSVVLMWEEDGYKILLTGDSGFQAEEEMLEDGVLSDVDILKVGHHGSKYSSGKEYLDLIDPELAIISVGEKNRYGHPTMEVLERLIAKGVRVERTDKTGDIKVILSEKGVILKP